MKEVEKTQVTGEQSQNKARRRRKNRNNRNRSPQKAATGQNNANQPKSSQGRHDRSKATKNNQPKVKEQQPQKVSHETVKELLLPSAALLHKFEFAVEGGAERLLDIVKTEQEHRHQWENYALKSHIKSQRLGLLFGLILGLVALFLINGFADDGKEELAQIVAIAVFGSIAFAALLSSLFAGRQPK